MAQLCISARTGTIHGSLAGIVALTQAYLWVSSSVVGVYRPSSQPHTALQLKQTTGMPPMSIVRVRVQHIQVILELGLEPTMSSLEGGALSIKPHEQMSPP